MAIKFFTDKIQIGDYNLFEGNGGIQFDGVARAEKFQGKTPGQGYQEGYFTAGYPGNPPYSRTIYNFPFANESVKAPGAEYTEYVASFASASSPSHGYRAGGDLNHPTHPPGSVSNTIERFPFSNNANATDVGDLAMGAVSENNGHQSLTDGFTSGGLQAPAAPIVNTINRFPFASTGNSVDHGDITQATSSSAPASSPTHGYDLGGRPGVNIIQKFPFASTSGAKDVGDLTVGKYFRAGCSSDTHAYAVGGVYPGSNVIEKVPYATDANSTDVGDTTQSMSRGAGVSSITDGYTGGDSPRTTNFQKFPFATDSNSVDLSNLPAGGAPFGSNQV